MKSFLSNRFKNVLVTGGAGFIGSNFILKNLDDKKLKIFNLDKISYASNYLFSEESLIKNQNNLSFLKVDLKDQIKTRNALEFAKPDLIINFAAESHVDKSITNPRLFLESNTVGTFNLLEEVRDYWNKLSLNEKENFKFLHVSTDEVYGSLTKEGKFSENSPYLPSSPYSASKAASDHFVNSWHITYKIPTVIINCSNNYGPRQYPEKLIPLTIKNIINNIKIPIYGNGTNRRDWIYVDDHIDALFLTALNGSAGKKYCIGGGNDISNIELVKLICKKLDRITKRKSKAELLIKFIKDRPGHDFRYSIDSRLIKKDLNWEPITSIDEGLDKTIKWYLNNPSWLKFFKNNILSTSNDHHYGTLESI